MDYTVISVLLKSKINAHKERHNMSTAEYATATDVPWSIVAGFINDIIPLEDISLKHLQKLFEFHEYKVIFTVKPDTD